MMRKGLQNFFILNSIHKTNRSQQLVLYKCDPIENPTTNQQQQQQHFIPLTQLTAEKYPV